MPQEDAGEPSGCPPEEGQLAKVLEEMQEVRNRILCSPGYFTQWLNPKAINVKSAKAMGLNAKLLEKVAEWWCPHFGYADILTIDVARNEASFGLIKKSPSLCWNLSNQPQV